MVVTLPMKKYRATLADGSFRTAHVATIDILGRPVSLSTQQEDVLILLDLPEGTLVEPCSEEYSPSIL